MTSKKPEGTASYINWHKGTLWPYESMAGVGAKFCFLNRISPQLFHGYLVTLCQKFASADFLLLMDRAETDIGKFALDLGEPLARVKELKVARFFPPDDYFRAARKRPSSVDWISRHDWHKHVSYCPACVRRGFHASFHQIAFLSTCLLHGDKLKKFQRRRPYWNYVRPDLKFVADVYELLFGGESGWNFHCLDEWYPHAEAKNLKIVIQYLSLVEEAWSNSDALHERWVAGSSATFSRDGVDVLRCHHWPKPFPGKLSLRVPQEGWPAVLTKKKFLISGCREVVSDVPSIYSLVDAQRQWALLLQDDAPWLKLAAQSIEEMLLCHRSAQVAYTYFRVRRSVKRQKGFDENIRRIFPRIVSIRELQDKWLTPYYHQPHLRCARFSDVFSSYLLVGKALENLGLANKVVVDFIIDGPDQLPHRFHQDAYQIVEPLKELIDAILYAELLDDIWNAATVERQVKIGKRIQEKYRTAWCVLHLPPEGLELHIWSRTPSCLPIWDCYWSDRLSGAEKIWKYGVLASAAMSGKLSRQRQRANPVEAEDLATRSWAKVGKPLVSRFQ